MPGFLDQDPQGGLVTCVHLESSAGSSDGGLGTTDGGRCRGAQLSLLICKGC